jgi:hypothetical protein
MGADAAQQEDGAEDMQRQHDPHSSSIPLPFRTAIYSLGVPEQARKRVEVVIPQAWLLPNLAIDAVRALQSGETSADIERGELRMSGVEVLVARNWIRDEFWARIQDAVRSGYAAEKTYTYLRAHAERRTTNRPKAKS